MKHIIILGDGMADRSIEALGNRTPLQEADTPYMDMLARKGRNGRLITVPEGFPPGSEVANTAIMGYDLNEVYEGRGPLEAASIGYEMRPDDMAIRCNIICLSDGKIKNHHGGHLTTADGDILIRHLDRHLGNERVRFITGIQYRHLLVVRGGNKHITCSPPHDHPDEPWHPLLVEGSAEAPCEAGRMTSMETATLLNDLILRSQELLSAHPLNLERRAKGLDEANSIWPWSPGYRPSMAPLSTTYPEVHSGSVISAVDLIKGIGHYAGLKIVEVEGATGLYDTNYEGKAAAAIEALRHDDFVFLHLEASDEAGHDGNLALKMRTIEYLDKRIVEPIYNEVKTWKEPVCIAILPDHLTPVETRTHVKGPVPFIIWHRDIQPDSVSLYDEVSAVGGSYGLLRPEQFMQIFMRG